MPEQWYYQNQGESIGPVSDAELRYLIGRGIITAPTLVRRRLEDEWLALDKTTGLPGKEVVGDKGDGAMPEISEWHFTLKGQSKQGPIPWRELKAMSACGELQPEDLVWKPGMALWVQASQVRGLTEELRPTRDRQPRFIGRFGERRPWGAAAVAAVLVVLTGAAAWSWVKSRPRRITNGGANRALDAPVGIAVNGGTGDTAVEQLVKDARSAVRLGQLERATGLLEQYLASPLATQSDTAKVLLREIKLVGSAAEAVHLAQDLRDETLKEYLQDGVQSLVSDIGAEELRPIYERTLLQALRQENNRRQMIPRGPIAENPDVLEAAPIAKDQVLDRPAGAQPQGKLAGADPQIPAERPKRSILGQAAAAEGRPGGNPEPEADIPPLPRRPRLIPADLEYVLARPGEFIGSTLVLNGLFKVGSKIEEVRGPDGQVLGWSLPVARNDDTMVCSGDGEVAGHEPLLLLDDGLATFLGRVFDKLGIKPTIRPSYKCILTVTPRRILVNGAPTPVVAISTLEVLGGCNYVRVARHQYGQAFRTLTVTHNEADVDFGDGDLWVERLGGEENFVKPIRRKFRDMQRRAITNHDSAVIDTMLQRELVKVVNTASAINQIVAMEGLRRMRILP